MIVDTNQIDFTEILVSNKKVAKKVQLEDCQSPLRNMSLQKTSLTSKTSLAQTWVDENDVSHSSIGCISEFDDSLGQELCPQFHTNHYCMNGKNCQKSHALYKAKNVFLWIYDNVPELLIKHHRKICSFVK